MPRVAREKSSTGVYHILLRGINREAIFHDDEDMERFLLSLMKCQEKSGFKLYAYCLMTNHNHFLIKEEKEETGIIMKRIGAGYVRWYNWKYNRCGHLFQDRFRSEAVEDESYLLTVLRYIHQNPVKAGMTKSVGDYRWSSYVETIKGNNLLDTDFVLGLFDDDREKALKAFRAFNEVEVDDVCLELEKMKRVTDREAEKIIKIICDIEHCAELASFLPDKRNFFFGKLKKEGLTTRQLERITGVGRSIIIKA